MQPRYRLLILFAVLALLAAACGDDDEVSTTTQAPGTTAAPTTMAPTTMAPTTMAPTTTAGPTPTTMAPTTTAASGDPCEPLVAAGEADGALTLYGSPTENVLQTIGDAFTAKYGIPVEILRLSGSSLAQRFSAESEAGTFAADVLFMTDSSTDPAGGVFGTWAESGWIENLNEVGIPGWPWDLPSELIRENRALVQIQVWLFSYNTDIVDDPPQQWPDLLDPRFESLVLLPDPNSSLAYLQVWQVVLDEYGEEWFNDFRSQILQVYPSGAPATEALGAGEGGLELPSTGGLALGAADRGAPIDITIPDATTGVEIMLALPDQGRVSHPAAAQLFSCYVINAEGNEVLNDFPAIFGPYSQDLPSKYVSPPGLSDEQRSRIFELLGVEESG